MLCRESLAWLAASEGRGCSALPPSSVRLSELDEEVRDIPFANCNLRAAGRSLRDSMGDELLLLLLGRLPVLPPEWPLMDRVLCMLKWLLLFAKSDPDPLDEIWLEEGLVFVERWDRAEEGAGN